MPPLRKLDLNGWSTRVDRIHQEAHDRGPLLWWCSRGQSNRAESTVIIAIVIAMTIVITITIVVVVIAIVIAITIVVSSSIISTSIPVNSR